MTKAYPSGDPGRFHPNDQTIIRFALPSSCPITNPPLEVCVIVWDNSPCDQDVNLFDQCDGDYAGAAGVLTGSVWTTKGRARFCMNTLLSESPIPNMPVTSETMLISTVFGDSEKAKRQNFQGYLALIMYNPTRSLVIPISND